MDFLGQSPASAVPGIGARRKLAVPAIPPASLPKAAEAIVIGAGIIGLSIGFLLARRGLAVTVVDRGAAGEGTSLAATGMLAASAEFEPGGADLLPFALESQRLWPAFRDQLEAQSGIAVDHRGEGTLVVAIGRDEVDRLRARHAFASRHGLDLRWLSGTEARQIEPGLRPTVTAAMQAAADHQVDPPRVMAALRTGFCAAGGVLVEQCDVQGLETEGGRVTGIRTAQGFCRAPVTILATGAWAGEPAIVEALGGIPVRPLKGQSLALRPTQASGGISHVVWTEQIHLAPKSDGSLVVGATMEERGFDAAITGGGLFALLEAARRVLPGIEEMSVETVWSGFRPTTPDDAPIIGESGFDGLLLAVGHHRNGFLLAPVTAQAVADLVTGGVLPASAAPLGLRRFRNHTMESLRCA